MTEEFAAAFIKAQSVAAQAKIHGMVLENHLREMEDKSPAYSPQDFFNIENEYCISHNAMMEMYRE